MKSAEFRYNCLFIVGRVVDGILHISNQLSSMEIKNSGSGKSVDLMKLLEDTFFLHVEAVAFLWRHYF